MPTASKLVASVLFFAVGWVAALQVLKTMPEGMAATYFPITIAMIGFFNGWMVMGSKVGDGMSAAFANGIRTSAQIAFFGLALFALRQMFMRAANLRYDSPGEATVATLDLFLDYFLQSLTVPIWGVLLVGGAISGLLTEAASRRWR